mgnify:CR=1
CIRPAASVRSEPGSNSQVKKHKMLLDKILAHYFLSKNKKIKV